MQAKTSSPKIFKVRIVLVLLVIILAVPSPGGGGGGGGGGGAEEPVPGGGAEKPTAAAAAPPAAEPPPPPPPPAAPPGPAAPAIPRGPALSGGNKHGTVVSYPASTSTTCGWIGEIAHRNRSFANPEVGVALASSEAGASGAVGVGSIEVGSAHGGDGVGRVNLESLIPHHGGTSDLKPPSNRLS